MHHKLSALAVSIAAALGLIALPGLAAARTYQDTGKVNLRTAPSADAIAHPGCGWNPANNVNAQGSIDRALPPIPIYNGPDSGCAFKSYANHSVFAGAYFLVPDSVIVRCGHQNIYDGSWWDYLYDSDQHIYGWVQDQYVNYGHAHRTC